MSLETDLDRVLHSPRLPEFAEALQTHLAKERAARQRFYEEMTPEQKVEFIDGEVILHSPVRCSHLLVTGNIYVLLTAHVEREHLGLVLSEKCLCVFPRNDYEPDVVFFGAEKTRKISGATLKFPVPDLAVEVLSESTARVDRGVKFEDYAVHGVAEYWIVDPEAQLVEQYLARGGSFELVLKSGSGDIVSPTLAGLRLPIRAFFDPEARQAALLGILGKR